MIVFFFLLETTTSRKKPDTDSTVSESSIPPIKAATNGKDGGTSGIECQPTGIYTVADPLECNTYYQCDKGIRTRLNCPERQLFDADKRQCLEFERVFCGSRAANLADKNQCKICFCELNFIYNKFKVSINVMVYIRILNVIVIFIINVYHKIKCVKLNVQVIKNLVVIQVNVVQQVVFQCHVGIIFQEMLQYYVCFFFFLTLKY